MVERLDEILGIGSMTASATYAALRWVLVPKETLLCVQGEPKQHPVIDDNKSLVHYGDAFHNIDHSELRWMKNSLFH